MNENETKFVEVETSQPCHCNDTICQCKKEKVELVPATSDSNVKKSTHPIITKPRQIINRGPKIGRNQLCPCGSGKKFKKCCIFKKRIF